MSDELSELFRERFAGHETPVGPGVWEAIQTELGAAAASDTGDGLEDLFRERFNEHEVSVDPNVWANISSQLGHGTGAAASSGTLWGPMGWAAAGLGVLVISGAVYLFSAESPAKPEAAKGPLVELVQPSSQNAAGERSLDITPKLVTGSRSMIQPETQELPERSASTPTGPKELYPDVASQPEDPAPEVPNIPEVQQGPELVERIIEQATEQARIKGTAPTPEELRKPMTTPVDMEEPEVERSPKQEEQKLLLHNVFTPNGDGENDTYYVLNAASFARIMTRVYNVRNNQLVFSTDTNEPWNGDNCLDGYYLVAVEALTLDGRLVTQGEVVWLTRNAAY